ncbi:DISP complex protein LRCH3 isoform 2-T2 [Menidia menidia]
MAASVLLGSVDGAGHNFTVGGPGSALPGSPNGLGPAGPVPWNRSLDRAMEEASVTGSLNLSGRKLKEFPRSAANHDLTDTTRADLSRNRLGELPLDVCLLVSLESLNLYQNCLRSLPDGLSNLQALTYLNLSRNQLALLPPVVCSLPLKVLIACNNKLTALPPELGRLRKLTELDVSCNEIQTLPAQVGQLENLRDLNIRRNHLVQLPPELAELPLVRLDFSCNRVASLPVCLRRLTQLQTIVLDNNPLQTPPAQICIKGKVHIFKYLTLEASRSLPDLPELDRRPLTSWSARTPTPTCTPTCAPTHTCAACLTGVCVPSVEELFPGRTYGALDSGFNSVDSGDKRWLGGEASEDLPEFPGRRVGGAVPNGCCGRAPSGVHVGAHVGEGEQIDFIDGCAEEEEEARARGGRTSLSSQFMAYIERRITREGSPVGGSTSWSEDARRHNRTVLDVSFAPSGSPCPLSPPGCPLAPPPSAQTTPPSAQAPPPLAQAPPPSQAPPPQRGVERVRREAQMAARRYDEERQRIRHSKSPVKASPDPEVSEAVAGATVCLQSLLPSRRSTHTDDSALFRGEDRTPLSPTANPSASLPGGGASLPGGGASLPGGGASLPGGGASLPGGGASCRTPVRPESFLYRLGQRRAGEAVAAATAADTPPHGQQEPQAPPPLVGEDAELVEQLRRNMEARLKVSLPADLGPALTDGVVLCHLANHVRPRSVPSIHVPSPAVPKLTMAKCRRNVENFLEACRRIGVPQTQLCLPLHILEERGLPQVARTVQALLDLAPPRQPVATATPTPPTGPPGPSVTI